MAQNENDIRNGLEQIQNKIYEIRDYLIFVGKQSNNPDGIHTVLPSQRLTDMFWEAAEEHEHRLWNELRALMLDYPDLGNFEI